MSTGSRSLFFDFSKPLSEESETPFDGAATGWIRGVKMTFLSLDGFSPGAHGFSGTIEFQAPAPDGSGNTSWFLSIAGGALLEDEDGDGTTDSYVLESGGAWMMWWNGSNHKGRGGRGSADPAAGWTWAGSFELPWGAVIDKQ